MSNVVRLAIVDPNDGSRSSVKNLLLGIDSVWLEAECSRYEFFADLVSQTKPDIALISLDSDQAKGLARLLWEVPLAAVYTSALPRATETAAYVAGPHSVNIHVDPRLNEIHHGAWEGLSEEELPDLELPRAESKAIR